MSGEKEGVVVMEADSTTYPFNSPLHRSPSVWSLETVDLNLPDNNLNEIEPDSTVSSATPSPDFLDPELAGK